MWDLLFTIAVAAAVCLSAVNVASEINKIQDVRYSPAVEYSASSGAPASERMSDAVGSATRKTMFNSGA
jgi:hypothetical protein